MIKNKSFVFSTVFLFAVAITKLIFYDLNKSNTVLKIFSFLVTGILFYIGGYIYRKVKLWD